MSRREADGSSSSGFVPGFAAGAVVVFLLLALVPPLREQVLPDDPGDQRIEQALDVIGRSYFRETDRTKLENASVEGMVRRLRRTYDDRFSHYFDPSTYERFQSATSGEFSGIGLTVSEVAKGLRVARIFEDTPAEEAGLEEGDIVVAVEGSSIAGQSATESASEIKGPPGSEVRITVRDGDSGKRERVTVERAKVRIPAVEGELRREGGKKIAYVGLATFSQGAHGELRAEIERLDRKGAEGLVLDLRGNGGGLLQEAILVTSIFQEEGPVVTTEGRTRARETLDATGGALSRRPMAVLTDQDTASASEIVAAALKQNDIAVIVGTKTFGKGTFQEVIELDDGAAIDLTVGEYLTADGTSILDEGVKPDIRTPGGDDGDRDAPLDRALRELAGQIDGD